MAEEGGRSLALDPTWSVAVVMSLFVAVSMLVERSIHRLSSWLRETNRKPLYEALEKMKEELMLLGFLSLLLTASSSTISNICINSKFHVGAFTPCTKSEVEETEAEADFQKNSKQLMHFVDHHSLRRVLSGLNRNNCKEGYEPFVSYEGLEELHRFIFIMAITHIFYSCLTMLLAIVKIHTWRTWEDEAHSGKHEAFSEIARELQVRRQAMIVKFHTSNPLGTNGFLVWLTCFFRQFGQSVVRVDYLALRMGFITNHNLTHRYDFHSYMVRSMEEEFHRIVGVRWEQITRRPLFRKELERPYTDGRRRQKEKGGTANLEMIQPYTLKLPRLFHLTMMRNANSTSILPLVHILQLSNQT